MPKLTFSKEPYFDDFSVEDNYFRVLFQPGRAIQTRELNQIQSIFNNQVEQFADHIFKFGSRVDAGSVRFFDDSDYVRLKDLDTGGNAVNIDYLLGKNIVGNVSGVTATVKHVEDRTIDDPYTIYVNYTGAGIDGETTEFIEGEKLNVVDSLGFTLYSVTVRCITCDTDPDEDTIDPVGKGSLFSVSESTYYVYGFFVNCAQQTVSLDKYSQTPTTKVGLEINQNIVTELDDQTLFDNALGTPNFTAAGADRYQITLTLVKKDIDFTDGENFIDLGTIRNGVLEEIVNRPQYADIMDMIARRTYDESGDYTVTPFIVTPMEHLKENANDTKGYLTEEDGGDESKMVAMMSPGKAYVKGYEIERIANFPVVLDKARQTEQRASGVVRKKFGNYLLVQINSQSNFIPSAAGTAAADRERSVFDFTELDIYDATVTNLSSAGAVIGTMRVKGMELYSIDNGTFTDSIWKLNIVDLQMNAGKTIRADAIGLLGSGMGTGGAVFGANIVPDTFIFNDSERRIFETSDNTLIYPLPYQFVKSVRDINNETETRTNITAPGKYYAQADGSGNVVFVANGNETFTSFNQRTWFLGALNTNNFEMVEIVPVDITVTSTTITIANLTAFEDYMLVAEVYMTQLPEKTKTITELVLDGVAADVTNISLTKADAYEITSIEMWNSNTYATYALAEAASAITDVTDKYTLNRNIQDNYYGISSIDLNTGETTPAADMVVRITFDYFLHGNLTNGAYFSVDSYEPSINDPNFNFTYEDIPAYVSKYGTTYNLTDCLDFRPIYDGVDFSGTEFIPSNDKNITLDIEYYLPRRDLLVITDNGEFKQVLGEASLQPKYPKTPDNAMAIYKVDLDAYTLDPLVSAKFKYIENKRYTMRDIGEFEDRIKNLQYYVSLNLLDQSLESMQVVDGAGNDRYKNGFLTDGFNDLRSGDTGSVEYKAAIDPELGELRPSFKKKLVNLLLDEANSTGYQVSSDMITLPYTSEVYDEQLFASKDISVNPYFIISKEGMLTLSPKNDVWKDTTTKPDVVVNVDTGFDAIRRVASEAGILGTVWNTTSQSSQVINRSATRIEQNTTGGWFGARTTTTTGTRTDTVQVTRQQTGTRTTIEQKVTNNSLGEFVTDVQLLTYIRPASVQFFGSRLPKNMRMYAFFDGVDVNDEVRPINGAFGDPLITDEFGTISGVFEIPNRADKRFYVGTRKFRLTNSSDDSRDIDILRGEAETDYHAGGLKQTKQETILSVGVPEFKQEVNTRTLTTTTQRNVQVFRNVRRVWDDDGGGGGGGGDPLAQSFLVKQEEGVFITKLDLYFSVKGTEDGVWLELREMVNGYPGPKILPYGRVTKQLADITVSSDASVATTFEFEAPVYLQGNTEYCWVLGSDDKENRIYASRLGGKDISTGTIISTQPHMGSIFKGQNNRTWNAEQYEDFKFKLYRASFDTAQTLIPQFNVDDDQLLEILDTNPIETTNGSTDVVIHHKNHGFVVGDTVKLNMVADNWFTFTLTSGNLAKGQTLTGATNGGTAKIKQLKKISSTEYKLKLVDLTGYFDNGETVTGAIHYESFDSATANKHGITINQTGSLGVVGNFAAGVDNTFNGIPLNELSVDNTITAVDTMDTYTFAVTTAADTTGFIGGSGIYVKGHCVGDALNLTAAVMDFQGDGFWTYDAYTHAGVGSTVSDYTAVTNQALPLGEVVELNAPIKIVNDTNETSQIAGEESFVLKGNYVSDSDYVSPVINVNSVSLETIANRCEWNAALEVEETTTNTGSELAKYVTKAAALRDPANVLTIYADVVNYEHSDVEFYYRVLNADDERGISEIDWTEIDYARSSSETPDEFKEIELNIPDNNPLLPPSELEDFKAFQVKIVMRTKNSARSPKVKRLRCLATT